MLRNCKRTRSSIDEGNGDSSTYVPSSSSTILDLFYSVLARKSIASYILELSTPELDICSRVEHTLTMWKDIVPINPEEFLKHLLRSRGYDYHPLPRSQSSKPTSKQIEDYTVELVAAVRDNDLDKLKALHASGICLSACNRHGESIVHIACRRASIELVKFLIDNGAEVTMEDDFGRTPLHDACWRAEPAFEIVTLLLRNHTDLIRRGDVRGALPLDYVRREHWLHWIAFLLIKADQYWPLPSVVTIPSCIDSESISTISDNSAGDSIGICSDATAQETGDEQATASAKRLRSLN